MKNNYMGCVPFDEKKARKLLQNPCFIDVKMDGRFNNVKIENGEITMTSRSGELVLLPNCNLIEELSTIKENIVLNGELTIICESNRARANGIIHSIIDYTKKQNKRTEKENQKILEKFRNEYNESLYEIADKIIYTVWDSVTIDGFNKGEEKTPLFARYIKLGSIVKKGFSNIKIIERKEVKSYNEAIEFFSDCLAKGYEGSVMKSYDGIWKNCKPQYQIKMKLVMSVDLLITEFSYGAKGTKNENVISSIICLSECGNLVSTPCGMSEEIMQYVTDNKDTLLNTCIEVECSGITHDKDGNYSLLHPRVKEFRTDKKGRVNTFSEIKEIEKMAKQLKN